MVTHQEQRNGRIRRRVCQCPLLGLQCLQIRLLRVDLVLNREQVADQAGPLQQRTQLRDRRLRGCDAAGHVGDWLGHVLRRRAQRRRGPKRGGGPAEGGRGGGGRNLQLRGGG